MKKQFFQSFLLPYLAPCLVVMAVMSLMILSYNLILGLICLVVCIAMMFYQGSITQKTGDNPQAGMLAGSVFPLILVISLFLIRRQVKPACD